MSSLNDEQPGGWRYDPKQPLPRDDSQPAPFTVGGLTDEQRQQQRQAQAATAHGRTADQLYAGLVAVARIQANHIATVDAKAKAKPNFYPPERIKAEVNGEEPDSPKAMLMAAMKNAVDAADQAADTPVTLAQNRVDEIRGSLVTPGDAAEELRNTRSRDRVLRRLQTANDHGARATIAREALEQAADRAEFGTLLTELPSELASLGLDAETIHHITEPVVRQRIPELAAAEDELAAKQFDATVVHHTAGVVRRGIDSGLPADKRVLAKLDPATIPMPPGFGR